MNLKTIDNPKISKLTKQIHEVNVPSLCPKTGNPISGSTFTGVQAGTDNGVRIYIDPATGKTRQPTPAERAEEARQSAEAAKLRKGKGVQYSKRADGTVRALDLEGRLMESVVVTTNADGSLSYSYVAGDPSKVQIVAPVTTLEEK